MTPGELAGQKLARAVRRRSAAGMQYVEEAPVRAHQFFNWEVRNVEDEFVTPDSTGPEARHKSRRFNGA
jgi:hypothetical protein